MDKTKKIKKLIADNPGLLRGGSHRSLLPTRPLEPGEVCHNGEIMTKEERTARIFEEWNAPQEPVKKWTKEQELDYFEKDLLRRKFELNLTANRDKQSKRATKYSAEAKDKMRAIITAFKKSSPNNYLKQAERKIKAELSYEWGTHTAFKKFAERLMSKDQ
jgi:hypothetical protein